MGALARHRTIRIDMPGSARSHARRRAAVDRAAGRGGGVGLPAAQRRACACPRAFDGHHRLPAPGGEPSEAGAQPGPVRPADRADRRGARQHPRARRQGSQEGMAGMQDIAQALMNGATSPDSRQRLPAAAAFVRESLMRQDADGYARSCEALAEAQGAAVERIEVATLLVTGDEDTVAPPQSVRAMAERMQNVTPGVRVVVLNRCGHWTPIERPEECAREAAGLSFVSAVGGDVSSGFMRWLVAGKAVGGRRAPLRCGGRRCSADCTAMLGPGSRSQNSLRSLRSLRSNMLRQVSSRSALRAPTFRPCASRRRRGAAHAARPRLLRRRAAGIEPASRRDARAVRARRVAGSMPATRLLSPKTVGAARLRAGRPGSDFAAPSSAVERRESAAQAADRREVSLGRVVQPRSAERIAARRVAERAAQGTWAAGPSMSRNRSGRACPPAALLPRPSQGIFAQNSGAMTWPTCCSPTSASSTAAATSPSSVKCSCRATASRASRAAATARAAACR